jgi:hypothetical protein
MASKVFNRQRLKHSHLINEKIKELTKKSKVKVTRIEWDSGTFDMQREDFHNLKIFAERKTAQEKFFDENITDFPYEDGGVVMNKIKTMIKTLKK